MIIRKLRFTDFYDINKLNDYSYTEIKTNPLFGTELYLKKPTLKVRLSQFNELFKNLSEGNLIYYVAVEDLKIIGYCTVKKADIPDSELSHVGILSIHVAHDFRNKGVGSKLLKYTLNKCINKFDIVELNVFSNNIIAKRLYKKMGFKRWGIAPGFVKRGRGYIDLEHMYLDLRNKKRIK